MYLTYWNISHLTAKVLTGHPTVGNVWDQHN